MREGGKCYKGKKVDHIRGKSGMLGRGCQFSIWWSESYMEAKTLKVVRR